MKLTELKPGDWVKILDEDVEIEGTVMRVSQEEVCIDNGVQEFWYSLDHVYGVPLDEEQLMRLGFEKIASDEGIKYGKGAFRIWLPSSGDFSRCELWYREDRRHIERPLMVHELQNAHLEMTKVVLEP